MLLSWAGMRPTGNDVASARMATLQGPYVLLEVPDKRAYNRVKLCRTMVRAIMSIDDEASGYTLYI